MMHRTLLGTATLLALVLSVPWSGSPVARSESQQSGSQSPASPGQTMTRLPDGRWLLVGAEGASIRDPRSNTTTPTAGTPTVPRAWHTATLLPNGSVLLIGGQNATGLVDIPEVFEPATGTFTPLSIAGMEGRASHTATLLLDGRVVVAGGRSDGSGPLRTEIWDLAANEARTVAGAGVDRSGHTATLAPDGQIIMAGGRTAQGAPAAEPLLLDPVAGSLSQYQDDRERAPHVAASIPAANLTEVPTETHVALRFSDAMAADSLTSETLTLTGPEGFVTTTVIPAEDGRLAFVWPSVPLAEGATYEVTVSGVIDNTGSAIVPASIRFTTKRRTPASDDAINPEAWTPNAADGEHGWRTNRPPSPWESLAPLVAPPGVTAVSGRVLRLDGRPLPDVTLALDGRETRSDRTGRFLLPVDPWTSRMATLVIDARTANQGNRTYGFYEARIGVRAGGTNVLPFTIWSPLIDTAHQVRVPSPTLRETVVSTPVIPGLELHLPPGTVITDEDHQIARTVSITPIPLDRTPFPLPDNATFSMFFTIQPGGAYLSTPGPVKGAWIVYPNVRRSAAGSRVQFFNYDPDDKGWYPYGMGTMTATSVVPDPKTRIYAFTGASFNDGTPAPPAGPPPGDCCGSDGDPVNLTTGIFTHEMTDLVVSDVLPLVLTRTYNSQDPYDRAFGVGMSHTFGLFERSESWPAEADLYLPDGAKIHFARVSDPALPTELTVFEHTATPTAFFKARMTFWGELIGDDNHGWNVTLKDGTVYVFPHAGSPLQAIRDRHGNEIRLTWSAGLLQRVTSPNGRWLALTYGPGGRVSQVKDNIGRTVSYTYDANGRLSTVTDPENHVTSYSWDANNRMTGVRPPNLQETQTNLVTNEYTTAADAPTPVGWVKKQTFVDGGVYQFAYNVTNGKSTETHVTNPVGYVRRVIFNADGYTTEDKRALSQPEEQTTTFARPNLGQFITEFTNDAGARTVYVRDAFGNGTSVTRCLPGQSQCTDSSPGSLTTRYTYEPRFNQVATITDPLNHTTTYGYDNDGHLTSITDPLQHHTTFAYNSQGLRTSSTDALQHTVTLGYASGDLTTVTDPLNRVTTRFSDAAGRVLMATDPLGNTIRYTYDANGQVRTITDALGGQMSLEYFPSGQLRNVTDAKQHTTSYTYDEMGRLASRTDPLQRTETFTYDLNGNLTQWTDRKGQVTTRTYDALNRLHQIIYQDASTITYIYDNRNRLTQIVDSASGTIVSDYDDFGRRLSDTTPQGVVSYTYDAASRRRTMTVQGQPAVTYDYDDADRLTSMSRGPLSVSMTYDNANRRSTVTLPNGIVTEYSYDDANQTTNLIHRNAGIIVGDVSYSYDSAGRRVSLEGSWARTVLPMAVSTTLYDDANQLLQWGNEYRQYDANGSLASAGFVSYTWDSRRRLSGASRNGYAALYSYDATDRRVSTVSNGISTSFTYDGVNKVSETTSGNVVSWLAGREPDEWLAAIDSGGVFSYLSDALRSTVAITNSGGTPVSEYTYEPFGSTLQYGINAKAQEFTGRERDDTGLYYHRARYYDPGTSRFISEDPIQWQGGNNFYAYVDNNPLLAADPFGLSAFLHCEEISSRRGGGWIGTAVLALSGPLHCYIRVTCPGKYDVTLELYGPQPGYPNGKPVMDTPNPSRNMNATADPIYGPGCGSDPTVCEPCPSGDCRFEDELIKQFYKNQPPPTYNPRGPNSNTFAAGVIIAAGGRVVFPPRAYGFDYGYGGR